MQDGSQLFQADSGTLRGQFSEEEVSFLIMLMVILELTLFDSGLPRFGHVPVSLNQPQCLGRCDAQIGQTEVT